MDEKSVSNQFSPIDLPDSNGQFETPDTNLNEKLPSNNLNETEDTDDQSRTIESNENKDARIDVDDKNEQCSGRRSFEDVDKTNLNDDISDDDEDGNFEKDDELDFEEGENSRGDDLQNPQQSLQSTRKPRPAEDGEVNSEEELEDGEVKEDSEDEEDQYDGDMNNLNKSTPANLNALCRFYSKGLCTWGTSCRFVHQKPIGTSASFSPKSNLPLPNKPPTLSTPPLISKSNESLNQIKPNNSYPKHNVSYTKVPLLPTNSSGSSYFPNQDQYRYVKKEPNPYLLKNYPASRPSLADDADYDTYQSARNKYADDRGGLSSSSSNYPRNAFSSSSYYTSIKPHHQSSSSSQPTHHQSSSSSTVAYTRHSSSGNSYESEYERKRRLAFESAPWNDGTDLNTSPLARDSPIDRHSQSSGSKMYKHQHSTSLSSNYVKKPTVEHSNSAAEHYRDPWRRSKSPQPFSGSGSNRGTPHQQTTPTLYSKSKSDSGSNLSNNSESELMEHSHAKSRRLDPAFAHKHRPASFREEGSNGGEAPYDHQTSSSNKKSLNYTKPPSQEELDNQTPYHHHTTSSTAYQKSSINTEMDIPNYERPKNLPPRTRKDSWSDSDSCSSSTNSSYSGTGESESDSGRDEPYSRTNKFESTREVTSEPQLKRQRKISSDNSRLSSSKPRSPYSPSTEFSSSSRYSTTGRKKHSIMNCEDDHSSERTLQKRLKSGRYDLEHNGSNNDTNDSNASDSKKAELLQQLKAIEEEIARKRSKLK